ncbi:MAG: hypothetical protein AB1540_12620 [Bdellovibrionota bacterium]
MNQTTPPIHVAGAEVAEFEVPKILYVARLGIALGIFLTAALGALAAVGWGWLSEGFSPAVALWGASIVTVASGLSVSSLKSNLIDKCLGLTRKDKSIVFIGVKRALKVSFGLFLLAALGSSSIALLIHNISAFPLPSKLNRTRIEVRSASAEEKLWPVYFWDYATLIDPAELDRFNLIVPYEKGPPERLLSKVYWENPQTHSIELELHGKRPRAYSTELVAQLFASNQTHPRDWSLVWKLSKEAGLFSGRTQAESLHLIQLEQAGQPTTHAIGVPWTQNPNAERTGAGRFFFWGPDGSVFQVKCAQPCGLSRILELAQFAPDPKGSRAQRVSWTQATLKKLLGQLPEVVSKKDATARRRHETLLNLYLISLLTLDPRDPEAFFHLGKLARNRETLLSAIRYGRDVGMQQAALVELESMLNALKGD